MKKRHLFFYGFFRPLVTIFLKLKFDYSFTVARNLPETYIVLSNHNTDFDPLFVGVSFPRQMYFVASEHIMRWRNASKFLNYGFAPIARCKGAPASSTVMDILKRIRAGRNVCMFAEGVRSWDGVTGPILPSTGKLIKSARCGLVTYKLEGGYFVSPNWSRGNLRRGRMHGAPVNVYTAEQLAAMSADEVNRIIARDLHEDAYERQLTDMQRYRGKNIAQKLENLCFICPECGEVDSMRSDGDTVTCGKCGHAFRYTEYCMLEGTHFTTVKELAAWIRQRVAEHAANGVAYAAENARLSTVSKHTETPVSEGPLSLGADGLTCGDARIPLADITDMAMHGNRTLVFSTKQAYYELCPDGEDSVYKFQLLFEAYARQNVPMA